MLFFLIVALDIQLFNAHLIVTHHQEVVFE